MQKNLSASAGLHPEALRDQCIPKVEFFSRSLVGMDGSLSITIDVGIGLGVVAMV